ncbi:hypothetical protein Natpe_3528 [Natrinema pellirubrum DSM 15624]|uniref:Uncharacterized protein n=1 Tax=Natrinema pellirubrum (strain DSM 15624 / CIP 106293 / JCM 10476 / NCIMB 786 / 157) TaxID=797303 RepID=L0JR81_NATP1|nr:hypothetical protein Natpe_3528 [Natrinema pellirubrum DSM 15624]
MIDIGNDDPRSVREPCRVPHGEYLDESVVLSLVPGRCVAGYAFFTKNAETEVPILA